MLSVLAILLDMNNDSSFPFLSICNSDSCYHFQVLGAIYGVKFLIYMFPEIGKGPKLNVNIHQGALTEGLLTFMIVSISLSLARSIPGSFVRKTWISSLSKLTLNILGSDLTGGCMNPASVCIFIYPSFMLLPKS